MRRSKNLLSSETPFSDERIRIRFCRSLEASLMGHRGCFLTGKNRGLSFVMWTDLGPVQ